MDVTKPYEFMGFGAMDVTKPYEFIGFGAMEVTKADFQPNLAPKPLWTDGARPAVPVAPKISPADQF